MVSRHCTFEKVSLEASHTCDGPAPAADGALDHPAHMNGAVIISSARDCGDSVGGDSVGGDRDRDSGDSAGGERDGDSAGGDRASEATGSHGICDIESAPPPPPASSTAGSKSTSSILSISAHGFKIKMPHGFFPSPAKDKSTSSYQLQQVRRAQSASRHIGTLAERTIATPSLECGAACSDFAEAFVAARRAAGPCRIVIWGNDSQNSNCRTWVCGHALSERVNERIKGAKEGGAEERLPGGLRANLFFETLGNCNSSDEAASSDCCGAVQFQLATRDQLLSHSRKRLRSTALTKAYEAATGAPVKALQSEDLLCDI